MHFDMKETDFVIPTIYVHCCVKFHQKGQFIDVKEAVVKSLEQKNTSILI
jgi:hypothetical protein